MDDEQNREACQGMHAVHDDGGRVARASVAASDATNALAAMGLAVAAFHAVDRPFFANLNPICRIQALLLLLSHNYYIGMMECHFRYHHCRDYFAIRQKRCVPLQCALSIDRHFRKSMRIYHTVLRVPRPIAVNLYSMCCYSLHWQPTMEHWRNASDYFELDWMR